MPTKIMVPLGVKRQCGVVRECKHSSSQGNRRKLREDAAAGGGVQHSYPLEGEIRGFRLEGPGYNLGQLTTLWSEGES